MKPRSDGRGRGRVRERGYLVVLTAFALLPIVVFVSFSVDVGAWYARASKLQRTADAAALAGVVWMPDLTKATSVALETVARNGITPSATLSVTVSAVPNDPHLVKVTISDGRVPQFFSKVVMGPLRITRAATARYQSAIPLGSPNNYFGTGSLFSGAARENVWAAVSGYCSAKENGDLNLARYDNAYNGSGYDCSTVSGTVNNADYDPAGYLFEIKMPATNVPTTVGVEVFDGAFGAGSTPNPDLALVSGAVIDTTFRLLDKGPPATPLTHAVLASTVAPSGNTGWRNWRNVGTISNPCASCVYYLQVFTAVQTNSAGSNGFAVRAVSNGTFGACSTITGSVTPPFNAGCVQMYPREEMSVYANLSGTAASFYLASIHAGYAGRQMSVTLFDTGEGATRIELLDPNGVVTNFNWKTPCSPPTPATGGCSGTNVSSLNPGVTGAAQPFPRLVSTSVFNDRPIELTVTLPSDYATRYGTNTWWRIRYTVGTSPTDRTTWTARVHGSPVHLVEG
jgi:Putative Flp pilus-assembly TadE/G-like